MRTVCLVDGEHYLPVTKDALAHLGSRGHDIVGTVFLGGTEKIGDPADVIAGMGVPTLMDPTLAKGEIPFDLIEQSVLEHRPEVVVDLSDEPVVTYHSRFLIASLLLRLEVSYLGAEFRFDPPDLPRILTKPSISVIGTAKRVGKTAIAGFIARAIDDAGLEPVIVTMGRGGPPEPEVIHGEELELSPEFLLAQVAKGKHAASDHWEDALTCRITTIGSRRCGGGMAGQVFDSNVPAAARTANAQPGAFVIMEGSGTTFPPVFTDARVVLVHAAQPLEYFASFFGPYRVGMSDLAIVSMCEPPMAGPEKVASINGVLREANPDITIANAVFRPRPMGEVRDRRVMLVMTAPVDAIEKYIIPYLEEHHGCQVVGFSSNLSNRPLLREDLAKYMGDADTVLVEVKAAAIDVATKEAIANGLDVVYMDNEPKLVGGDVEDLRAAVVDLAQQAVERFGGD
jgi:cyclic 2,3-diphosphoglycerate synthetase